MRWYPYTKSRQKGAGAKAMRVLPPCQHGMFHPEEGGTTSHEESKVVGRATQRAESFDNASQH